MHLKDLTIDEFTSFASTHPLSSYYQTFNYALLKAESNYEYDLIGMVDHNNNILAASLILFKPIGIMCKYGYAPRGFLIDYNNEYLVSTFTDLLKKHYYEKSVIFIKVNPNIKIGKIDTNSFATTYNENANIRYTLENNSYKKLKDNLYFEAQLPRFNAIIDLKKYNSEELNKNTKNKIKKGIRKGLVLKKYSKEYLDIFYNLIKNKKDTNEFYYRDYFTSFSKNDSIDLFLVSVNYYDYLQNSQYLYDIEQEKNTRLNEKLIYKNSEKAINSKMSSDKTLLTYKNDIVEATNGMNKEDIYIAGALVIRHNDTASIVLSGYDINYKRFAPNYFLHYSLIEYYKNDFNYLDLNGVVGDFTNNNPYSGLNRFKLGFNPDIYEYIGEYDLIIEPKSYEILLNNGILSKTFNKKDIKNTQN